ncbi:hypothetical protein GN958_ATG22255 [Phytophthora infestans]|uniref:Uncharacterized protein n=1 Tax=Phytophthora infestans TaxID=4787 RepID=A0A8S9TLM3_PHYIN|nr:hypothetical protein GN958_ATG22255 [Phytophthora infestans]
MEPMRPLTRSAKRRLETARPPVAVPEPVPSITIERNDGQQSQSAEPAPKVSRDGQRTQRRVRFQLPLGKEALRRAMPRGDDRRWDERKKI